MRAVAFACLLSTAALMAGCSPKGHATAGEAAGAPARKAGLWETTLTGAGRDGQTRAMTSQICLDAATDKLAPLTGRRGGGGKGCTHASAMTGGKYTIDSTCKRGDRTVTTHAEATGDFNSNYTVQVSTKVDPPREGGPAERQSTVSARYLGACQPDQKPGDVIMPNGDTYNITEGGPHGRGGDGMGGGHHRNGDDDSSGGGG